MSFTESPRADGSVRDTRKLAVCCRGCYFVFGRNRDMAFTETGFDEVLNGFSRCDILVGATCGCLFPPPTFIRSYLVFLGLMFWSGWSLTAFVLSQTQFIKSIFICITYIIQQIIMQYNLLAGQKSHTKRGGQKPPLTHYKITIIFTRTLFLTNGVHILSLRGHWRPKAAPTHTF